MPKNVEAELKDIFASTPLEEVLKPEEVEEFTEEDLEIINQGYELAVVKHYKEAFPKRKILTKGKPTIAFFSWYIERCNMELLMAIIPDNITEKQFGELEKTIDNYKYIGKPESETIAEYIQKNGELMETILKLQKHAQETEMEMGLLEESFVELVDIFIEQKIKAELTEHTIKLIKVYKN